MSAAARSSAGAQALARHLLAWAIVGLAALVFAYPLLFMLTASFKPGDTVFADLGRLTALLPDARWSLDNYVAVFNKGQMGH